MDDSGALERLTARMEMLERRVSTLEAQQQPAPAAPIAQPAANATEILTTTQTSGLFSVLGKAMLGIAGAYVLRAVAESGSIPLLAVAALAIVYALAWLAAAARVRSEKWLASAIYAGTSALILAPMLWELTLSFKVLAASATAGILCVFAGTATALSWKQRRAPVYWVANLTAAAAAIALSIATHDLLPFIAALLLLALAAEWNPQTGIRLPMALAADAAAWALIFIYASPQSARMDYPELSAAALIAPGCLLFAIYAGSIAMRATRLRRAVTVFETSQATVAFLLAASGVMYFAPGGEVALGAACLLLSAACYAAAFMLFSKTESRNFIVFSAWAAGLLLAGCGLSLPRFWLAAVLGLAAIAAISAGNRLTLKLHGLAFLTAAAIASGFFAYILQTLAQTMPGAAPARLASSVALVSVCAMICYAAGSRGSLTGWQPQLLRLALAALAVGALAALLVHSLLGLAALRIAPQPHHVAFLRTLVLCALALALAKAGSKWRRAELARIAYATLGLIAAKLLFEDLRLGHLELIAASIFLFAIALISVPHLARSGSKQTM